MLPTKRSKEEYALEGLRIIVYGPPGIGKSTFAAGADGAIFIATEKAHKNLDIYKVDVSTWEEFLAAEKEIRVGKHNFKMIVIDTVDNLFKMCQDYVGTKNRFTHPSDLQYGKGWDLIKTEFQIPLLRLSVSHYGLIFISHSDEIEITTRSNKITKTIPTMSKQARKIINPFVDIIGLCGFKHIKSTDKKGNVSYDEARVIRFEPSEYSETKDRTGLLDPVIPLSWKKFKSYFEGGE